MRDLAPPVRNQIARRDLWRIPIALTNMIIYSACDSALARLRTATSPLARMGGMRGDGLEAAWVEVGGRGGLTERHEA
jgi:hypothetical protein